MLPVGGDLKTDRYKHEAFKTAALALLERLTPPDPVTAPDLSHVHAALVDVMKDPRALGLMTAEVVWKQLRTMSSPPEGINAEAGTWVCAYPNARRDLGVESDEAEARAFALRLAEQLEKGK